jgi:hypothetical protein
MAGSVETVSSLKRLDFLLPAEEKAIWDSIYAGLSVKQTAVKLGFTFATLEAWFYDPKRLPLLNRARASLASQMAHETIAIADSGHGIPALNGRETANSTAPETFPDAARDKLRIQARQWLASKWDKDTYASTPQTVVNIDAKSLHIDSLRRSSQDLQTTARLNEGAFLPPVQVTDSTALLNAGPAVISPPASPSTTPSGDGGTPSRGKASQRNASTTDDVSETAEGAD